MPAPARPCHQRRAEPDSPPRSTIQLSAALPPPTTTPRCCSPSRPTDPVVAPGRHANDVPRQGNVVPIAPRIGQEPQAPQGEVQLGMTGSTGWNRETRQPIRDTAPVDRGTPNPAPKVTALPVGRSPAAAPRQPTPPNRPTPAAPRPPATTPRPPTPLPKVDDHPVVAPGRHANDVPRQGNVDPIAPRIGQEPQAPQGEVQLGMTGSTEWTGRPGSPSAIPRPSTAAPPAPRRRDGWRHRHRKARRPMQPLVSGVVSFPLNGWKSGPGMRIGRPSTNLSAATTCG